MNGAVQATTLSKYLTTGSRI